MKTLACKEGKWLPVPESDYLPNNNNDLVCFSGADLVQLVKSLVLYVKNPQSKTTYPNKGKPEAVKKNKLEGKPPTRKNDATYKDFIFQSQ